ncbi:DUF2273 domain-containing protein [Liquorilactobacillus cacaonum]|uniref:DUF2273 domain-containing protein n=1 Tax=Liquorilactobacillus cacaonum TaxID=483012 RepID=UPI00070A0923|nr:DUF2273 domain-containing protein [Liquorilactobacillus cacaonum]
MTELIKTYFWPIIGGLIGLLLAVLVITIGFFKTLVILIFIVLGITVGYYIQKSGILSNLFK